MINELQVALCTMAAIWLLAELESNAGLWTPDSVLLHNGQISSLPWPEHTRSPRRGRERARTDKQTRPQHCDRTRLFIDGDIKTLPSNDCCDKDSKGNQIMMTS